MTRNLGKYVITLTTGLTLLSTVPLTTLAEESVNQPNQLSIADGEKDAHVHGDIETVKEAKTGKVTEAEALKNIENAFKDVDGKGDGSSRSMQPKMRSSNRIGYSAADPSATKKSGTISGIPFVEWIIPAGNTDIRPANPMKAKYITIHETANTAPGANAESHAKYLYNQATSGTVRTASWHFTVDDKEIYQHLPTNENGWHAGDGGTGTGNRESIGIEIAVNQDGDYNKAVENAKKLVAHLMKQEGISASNLRRHEQWSGKKCPDIIITRGTWNSFVEGANGYLNGGTGTNPPLVDEKEDVDGNETNPAEPNIELEITGTSVNVRSGAGVNYGVVRIAKKGEKYKVLSIKDGWYEIKKGEWVKYDPSWSKLTNNAQDKDPNTTKEGWVFKNNNWYYTNSDGKMATGWKNVGGAWYYLNSSGAMVTGWQSIGGAWYYLNSSGAMVTGWQSIGGAWYYLHSEGAMVTGWQSIGGKWYYLNSSGAMVTGWQSIGGKWYYLNGEGAMLTGWQSIGGKWYYLNGEGAMLTGWQSIGGKWYYLNGEGAMLTGWQSIGGKWYYLNGEGAMLTGWQSIGGKWYYLNGEGAMLTGWQSIGGNKYYFDQSGSWIEGKL
ncbi:MULTISPECIES: N-acetylmuramoyl-L-alanine amidase [Bacillus]|uniref:N-acetylmuramoyl-L-alanine amidase n=27 Tax=Bacillus TaxID=1386 RepID=A0A2C4EG51_9BACI|nr:MULTISPECIES: N-acetylmuramoyl-L-alanine amidase [Bacillus]ARC32844.1 N-acetylmuramoyl-L-alanine amidase [Bacillus sp. FDAARGOS_235]KAB2359914.1 SH3 domain-containing protein [Bacillus toyonensis]KAB2387519.1 SH3 domain-containing protein [Bacillus toyonensis]MBC2686869.1 SH3 domain-containing protein [Bacillus toyonensis]MBH0361800.1 N-acetylmuramoyl-L-alanine amidase [Bacillus toyonensis biovar Thuringiensis]